MNENKYKKQLIQIVQSNEWLMKVLRSVQQCNLPDWFVAAGVIRSVLWDSLHRYNHPTPVKDIDVIFYDLEDLSFKREEVIKNDLNKLMPNMKWDVKNQAAVHLWFKDVFGYSVSPLESSEDAIKTWNSTSIGIRLLSDEELYIASPYGLTDLFDMKFRRNTKHIPKDIFMKKLKERGIKEKWPKVQIIEE